VADHCCDLVPRKKGRPARNDPRFRPKYPDKTNNHTHDGNISNSNIDNINSSDLGTGASDTETSSQAPSLPLEASGLWSRPERPHHHMYDHIDDLPCSDGNYGDDEEDEDDDEDDDDDVEEERWRRKQRRDERSREAEFPPDLESSSDLASRMIAMMADEMHQLRKENAKLRCKVKKLRKYKRAREEDTNHSQSHSHSNHNRGRSAGSANPKRPRYDDAPSPQPQPVETRPSSVAAGECVGLLEARKHMPFLNHYRMSADVPFVVGDLHSCGFQTSRVACCADDS
jgi:hypothetical protein